MKKLSEKGSKAIAITLPKEEYDKFITDYRKTTCRGISAYGRKLITRKPVTVYYRSQSFDELTEAYIQFKKDLDRLLAAGDFTEADRKKLMEEITDIKEITTKIYDHVRQNKEFI